MQSCLAYFKPMFLNVMEDYGIMNILNTEIYSQDDYKLTIGSLLLILVLFILTRLVLSLLNRILHKSLDRGANHGRVHSLYQIFKYVIWLIAIILMLQSVGIKITLLLAGSAALLVGLGFGLQQIFSDVVSGIVLLIEGGIKVGDILEVDHLVGKVVSINLRTSKILSRDGIIIIIPNHKFTNENVVNWSNDQSATRFSVTVGVTYGSDLELVKKVLLQCVEQHSDVIKENEEKKPIVWLKDFAESSINFELLFWSKNIFLIDNTLSDIRFEIDRKFHEHKIRIPFPQLDLHLIKEPSKT